jgi:hypothetical protein
MQSATAILIDALGGTTVVANGIHSPTSTVHSWRKNGVPPSRLAHMRLVFTSDEAVAAFVRFDEAVGHTAPDTAAPGAPSPGKTGDVSGAQVAA